MTKLPKKDELNEAVLKFFPQGGLWEEQKEDVNSDVKRWSTAFSEEIDNFYRLLADVHRESIAATADDTLHLWEESVGLPPDPTSPKTARRKKIWLRIVSKFDGNPLTIRTVAKWFGYTVTFEPSIEAKTFANLHYGERLYGSGSRILLVINVVGAKTHPDIAFEKSVRDICAAHLVIKFIYH